MERARSLILKEKCLLQRILKLRNSSCKRQNATISALHKHVDAGNSIDFPLQQNGPKRKSPLLRLLCSQRPCQNLIFPQRYYSTPTNWWNTPSSRVIDPFDQDGDEVSEDEQTTNRPSKLFGSTVIAQFKYELDSGEHSDWTHQDWEVLEAQLLDEKKELAKIWEAVCMKFLLHFGLTDPGISLLGYIRSKGRSPNIATLTAFIALCGKYGGKNLQDVVFKTYEELLEKSAVFDAGSCKCLVEGLSGTDRWREALDLIEMSKISQEPTSPYYSPVAEAAFREGDFSTGFTLLETMGEKGLMPQAKVLLKFAEVCALNGDIISMVALFGKFRRYSWFPTTDVAKSIEHLFLGISGSQGEGWQSSWTTVNNRGVCNACGQRMAQVELSAEDFTELQETFLQTALVTGNVFLKTSPEELQKFTDFIQSTAPYDIVLDSLNIAFRLQTKASTKQKVETLLQVVEHFVKRKKKVMLLGRKHMKSWPAREMNKIQREAQCFFTDNMSEDDPFLLYATLYSGPRAMFVSSDEMRDHKHLLGPRLGEVFKQWQRSRQIFFLGTNRFTGNLKLLLPKGHDSLAQEDADGWHIPYDAGQQRFSFQHPNTWLCLRQVMPKR